MPAVLPLTALPLTGPVDAESLFLRLFAGEQVSFWLDAGPEATEGWSILGTGEAETDADAVRAVRLGALPDAAAAAAVSTDAEQAMPPFVGGWVGWLDYEDGARRGGAPVHDGDRQRGGGDEEGSSGAWIAVTRAVAIDHASGRLFALAAEASAGAWRSVVQSALTATAPPLPTQALEDPHARAADSQLADPQIAVARHSVDEYAGMIEQCRAAIERGDAYQLCLTTRFTLPRPADPLTVYRRLRRATPAHHGGWLRAGERALLSASPEQFLSVEGRSVRTSPIKGTRPRATDPELDARRARQLQEDVKERAENVMIVDLMRNDLSRIGVPGSVRVERLWEVESYPAVHQLVSTVSARLRDGIRFGELCDATFPAGSMTGAPKLSAMSILHRLEGAPRGVYSGCFGYVGVDGRVDLAMVIRSIVLDGDEAQVGAGGGITWLSRPHAEAAEVATKARAPLAALGAVLPAAWADLDV